MKFGMSKEERNWVLYDVGNSAFVLLVSTIMPIYFNYLAENAGISSVDYLAYWGYAASAATIIVAFLGPVFGTYRPKLPKARIATALLKTLQILQCRNTL